MDKIRRDSAARGRESWAWACIMDIIPEERDKVRFLWRFSILASY